MRGELDCSTHQTAEYDAFETSVPFQMVNGSNFQAMAVKRRRWSEEKVYNCETFQQGLTQTKGISKG